MFLFKDLNIRLIACQLIKYIEMPNSHNNDNKNAFGYFSKLKM